MLTEEDLLQFEQAAAQGNKVAERLLLSHWLQVNDAPCIESLLERHASLHGGDSANLLRAELSVFHGVHGVASKTDWQHTLRAAAEAGMPEALFVAAVYHDWVGRPDAARSLLARISDKAAPNAADAALLWQPGWHEWSPPEWQTLADEDGVRVQVSTRFASDWLCGFFCRVLGPQLRPSAVIDPRTGQAVAHPVRINQVAQWPPEHLGWAGKLLETRLAEAAGYRVDTGEVLSLLHYRPGQRYKAHLDSLGVKESASPEGIAEGGQRRLTVLLALGAQAFRGGETRFPRLNVQARPACGHLLQFNNTDADERPLPAALHEGVPVEAGEKWLLSKWVRYRSTPYGRELAVRG